MVVFPSAESRQHLLRRMQEKEFSKLMSLESKRNHLEDEWSGSYHTAKFYKKHDELTARINKQRQRYVGALE